MMGPSRLQPEAVTSVRVASVLFVLCMFCVLIPGVDAGGVIGIMILCWLGAWAALAWCFATGLRGAAMLALFLLLAAFAALLIDPAPGGGRLLMAGFVTMTVIGTAVSLSVRFRGRQLDRRLALSGLILSLSAWTAIVYRLTMMTSHDWIVTRTFWHLQ